MCPNGARTPAQGGAVEVGTSPARPADIETAVTKARTSGKLGEAITRAFATNTASDARAWFKHCGYALR